MHSTPSHASSEDTSYYRRNRGASSVGVMEVNPPGSAHAQRSKKGTTLDRNAQTSAAPRSMKREKSMYSMAKQRAQGASDRLDRLRREKEAREMAQCSFQPNVKAAPRVANKMMQRRQKTQRDGATKHDQRRAVHRAGATPGGGVGGSMRTPQPSAVVEDEGDDALAFLAQQYEAMYGKKNGGEGGGGGSGREDSSFGDGGGRTSRGASEDDDDDGHVVLAQGTNEVLAQRQLALMAEAPPPAYNPHDPRSPPPPPPMSQNPNRPGAGTLHGGTPRAGRPGVGVGTPAVAASGRGLQSPVGGDERAYTQVPLPGRSVSHSRDDTRTAAVDTVAALTRAARPAAAAAPSFGRDRHSFGPPPSARPVMLPASLKKRLNPEVRFTAVHLCAWGGGGGGGGCVAHDPGGWAMQ
jgi:hypothetical protein